MFPTQSNEVQTFVASITSEIASYILNNLNPHNRPLRRGIAEGYASDMAEGRWTLTNQGIGFDKAGNLTDGQHRLYAIAMTDNITIPMVVTLGLETTSREHVDIGAGRTVRDILNLRGDTVTAVGARVAAVRAALAFPNGKKTATSKTAMIEQITKHEAALDFVLQHRTNTHGLDIASVHGVMLRAFYTVDHAKLARFMKLLYTGVPEDAIMPGDRTVLGLRGSLLNSTSGVTYDDRLNKYWKVEVALKHFIAGRDVEFVKIPKDPTEAFPIAGD